MTGRTYFLTDQLNSTIALTDPTGAIQQQYSYDPYGNVTASNTATGFTNPYQYTGREADTSALYYYRARYYSPQLPGFISEDPITFGGGQLSFYAYVGGNPLMYTDPYGLFDLPQLSQGVVDGAAGLGDALSIGITAWARNKLDIGSVNECSGFYHGGQAAGIIGGLVTGEGEIDIVTNAAHYAPSLIDAGVDVANAQAAVAGEIQAMQEMLNEGEALGNVSSRITVDGQLVQYNTYTLPNGSINFGTIYPVLW